MLMQHELYILIATAITISFLHTISGPDHYLPFIALAKTRGWSYYKTIAWTSICGLGHIGSSLILGLLGATIGWSLSGIEAFNNVRGSIAGWALLCFGIVYMIWGYSKALQNRKHKHFDVYDDGSVYVFEHKDGEVVPATEKYAVTPWVMFIIFVLGPCEPMIPLLYFPAAKNSTTAVIVLIVVYTLFTLLAMILMVTCGFVGLSFFNTSKLEKYIHLLGGITITICGIGMLFLSW